MHVINDNVMFLYISRLQESEMVYRHEGNKVFN